MGFSEPDSDRVFRNRSEIGFSYSPPPFRQRGATTREAGRLALESSIIDLYTPDAVAKVASHPRRARATTRRPRAVGDDAVRRPDGAPSGRVHVVRRRAGGGGRSRCTALYINPSTQGG